MESRSEGGLLKDPNNYMRLVGRLLYLTLTKPNINYSLHRLNQFMDQPRGPHMHAADKVLQYIDWSPRKSFIFLLKLRITLEGLHRF